MPTNNLSIRYAHAFYAWAKQQKGYTQVLQDVRTLLALFETSPTFQTFLDNPLDKPNKKVKKLTSALAQNLHPTTLAFLSFLINKKRESHLKEILRQMEARHKVDQHIRTAYLTTARPISDILRKEITQHIQQLTSQDTVELVEKRDPQLLGGYLLQVDDKQLDMSLRTQLENLQKHWEHAGLPNQT
ncbi:MAG: ATP synthase F1 subunit delta [Bacteroidota bacterium]